MQASIDRWIQDLNTTTQAFQTEFGGLSAEELNWKPNPKAWSIGQVMEHLIAVNRTYYPILDSLEAGTFKKPFLAKIPPVYKFFGNMILKGSEPTRKRKAKTFPMWEPTTSDVEPDILSRFTLEQQTLIDRIKSSKEFLERGAVIHSPVNRNIPYTLERAFDIITVHEKRHLNQAREVLKLMKAGAFVQNV